ncbi:hypothetical protein BOTNAR_0587g00050 [Botryotinia narcissicola]|uniref:COP9 signalosome complex subunit 3 N-terminal helical repeats domain-containing protein n=1 Tax=Botryotinia narcissicola TaxID=278944 RepID=A0A4Z1HGM5_9HELO|nr:hypothetical protein BOTNAR_0587g00050 [Botryotinia narcissicola]
MDNFLSRMLLFPPHPAPLVPLTDLQYDTGITSQIESLKKTSDKTLLQSTAGDESPLDVINPSLNTVPYIYVLRAHIAAAHRGEKGINVNDLWEKATAFLHSFDQRQIRYLGKEMQDVMEFVAQVASEQRQPGAAIPPIREAILRIDPSGSVLTSNHIYLVRLTLQTRYFAAITELIDKPILYIPARQPVSYTRYLCEVDLPAQSYVTIKSNFSTKLSPLEILEYFYYSGSIYIGLQRWDAALEMLENAIIYPSNDNSVSLVMVEAYKKWLLVGLLQYGKILQLPKTTSAAAAKTYHIIAKPYEAIAGIFETGSAARLKSEAEFGRQVWSDDANFGLICCVLAAYQKFQIRNLANVYSKIGAADIMSLTMSAETGAKLTSIKQIEDLVQSMIAEGTLPATMVRDQSGHAVVTFSPTGPVLSETQVQNDLVASTRRIQSLSKQIKVTDRVLTHDKRYIDSAQKAQLKQKNAANAGGTAEPLDWNSLIEDEDIMMET